MSEQPTFKVGDRVRIKDDAFHAGSNYCKYRGMTGCVEKARRVVFNIRVGDDTELLLFDDELELVTDAND